MKTTKIKNLSKFEETLKKVINSSDIDELKKIAKEVYDDNELNGNQKNAIIATYKARLRELKSNYLKDIYQREDKRIFWNLYSLMKNPDYEVRKRTIQIVYELNLEKIEKEILFSLYRNKNEDVDQDNEVNQNKDVDAF